MICKFILKIDGIEYELGNDCILNWDNIKCSLERKDYGGVTRAFSTQFEFVNEAYNLLSGLYLRDGVFSVAYISICTINNRWEYEKLFENRLDFTGLKDDGRVISLNSIDNSIATLIKANKSTKYELGISDFTNKKKLNYDRIKIVESVAYQVIGTTVEDDDIKNRYPSAMTYGYSTSHGDRVVCNYLSDNIEVGETITYRDQDSASGEYLIEVLKDTVLEVDYKFTTSRLNGYGSGSISLRRIRGSEITTIETMHYVGVVENEYYLGYYSDIDALKVNHPTPEGQEWALIGESIDSATVWIAGYDGTHFFWQNTGQDKLTYEAKSSNGTISTELKAGDRIYVAFHTYTSTVDSAMFLLFENEINFRWGTRGESVQIDVLKPYDVLFGLLNKMASGIMNVEVTISEHDERIANTYIVAAESIRGVSNAKLFTTFNDFCSWFETVFGYVYYIGSRRESKYKEVLEVGHYEYTPRDYDFSILKEFAPEDIYYITYLNKFLARDSDGVYYANWKGSNAYYDLNTGLPYTNKIYKMLGKKSGSQYVVFDENGQMTDYVYDISQAYMDVQTISFVHRSEIFGNSKITDIGNITDFSYNVESSLVYSRLKIGYNEQDYDSINGRDEWNFNSEYSTGTDLSDNSIELISKYRADCYGFEFVTQKRGDTSTDDKSDNNVFFVLCRQGTGGLILDREASIGNVKSDTVFNADFSILNCIKANKCYLSAIREGLILKYASSEGNSDVMINGESLSDDVTIHGALFSVGEVKFSTDDMDIPNDWNTLIRISNMGTVYTGYIKKAELKFGKQYGTEYTLIVKSVEYDN